MKKIICICLMAASLSAGFAKVKTVFDASKAVKDEGKVTMTDLSYGELIADMGTGWNLGNTMEATAGRSAKSETSWGQPVTTKQMIDGIAESGFKTIRIPASWSNHIIDKKYTIDPVWMNRVKQVVDWAMEDGLYVILNVHHDNFDKAGKLIQCKGYYPDNADLQYSEEFITNVWSQIALAFNNGYDQHLIFETLNEPRLRNQSVEWSYSSSNSQNKEAQSVINKLNQDAVNAIRGTKGNNAKRFIMVPGYAATPAALLTDDYVLPSDKAKGKLLVSVHLYTPYSFAGQAPGVKAFSPRIQSEFVTTFKKLNEKFIKNGTGVIIGEYGAVNKNNPEDRNAYFEAYIKYAKHYGMAACLWDNGSWEVPEDSRDYSEKFGYYNRKEQTWYFPEIVDAIMKGLNEE